MTPLDFLQESIADYRSGKKDSPALLTALTEIEAFVQAYAKQLEGMRSLPEAEGDPVRKLREGGVAKFQESIAELRKAAETGDAALCDGALKLAEQGDFLFGEVMTRALE